MVVSPDDPEMSELLLDLLRDEEGQGEVLDKETAKQLRKIKDADKVYDGMRCSKCNDWYPMAEPNQDDGTLICYLCRLYG
jgi:hypothetical protein